LSSPSPLPQLTLSAFSISTHLRVFLPTNITPSLSRRYELNLSLGILEVEPGSLIHELQRRPTPFEAISGQTTVRWPACKFPATSVAFEAFSGQNTAS
ncbi:hypothetical protein DVH24_008600, partial [Malus domestica]